MPDIAWVSLEPGAGIQPAAGPLTDPPERAPGGSRVARTVQWAVEAGPHVALPGRGRTRDRWETLAAAGAHDLTAARVLEPHLDALAILDEAGATPGPRSSWGVFAAEAGGARLAATRDHSTGRWTLEGTKPWCSLAGNLSHALVTAWVSSTERAMFSVELHGPGITVDDAGWTPSGLVEIVTSTLTLDAAPAHPVGRTGWYLDRDGFAWGGIGVAAVWYGGAVGLARRLLAETDRREPDQVALMHLGAVDAQLTAARAVLAESATAIDAGRASGPDGALLAARVRLVVADLVDAVTSRVGHALGPGPLAHEADHARRVADLTLYVRQHHAERDAAALGRLLTAGPSRQPREAPW